MREFMKTPMTSFFFTSRRRHTRWPRDWSSDVCSSDLQLAGQREEAQEMAKHVEDYGDVLWAVPAGQLGYRSGSTALCKQVEAARAEHPDAHVLVAVCIAPKVERITVTDLPAEPQPERIQAAAVNNKKGCVA